eukprot:SAG31_NODE_84_length_27014_cov_3.743006_11_plen_136_part_00
MYEKAQWHASISNLLRQIEVTVTPEEKETQDNTSNTSVDFSPEDIREELERLRNDERPAECLAIAGDICAVPSQVPEVARGLQITSEMKQLAAVLMTGKKRVGLCGVVRFLAELFGLFLHARAPTMRALEKIPCM